MQRDLLSLNLYCQIHILSFVPLDELFRTVSRTCKRLAEICAHSRLWHGKFFLLSSHFDQNALLCQSAVVYSRVNSPPQVILYGGNVSEKNIIRDVKDTLWCFDYGASKWEQSKLARLTEHSSVVYKNHMYVFGGNGGLACNYTAQLQKYSLPFNPESRFETVEVTTPPSARSGHSAVMHNDCMYIFGGWDGKTSFGDMHQFNFVTNSWAEIPKQEFTPSPRRTHVAFVNRDKMFIFGGFDESRPAESFNELFSFDFVEKKWSLVSCKGDLPSGRSRCGQFLWKNFLYILGGWDRVRHFTDLYRLNLDTFEWEDCQTNLSSLSSGIAQHSCVVVGDWLHVYGGKFISTDNTMMASDRILVMRLGVSNPLPSSEPEVAEEDLEEMMMDEVMDERMQLLHDCMEDFMELDTIKEIKGRSSYRSFPMLCSSVSC